jgi:glycosyltransferase involved in cell wall biosynthesis
MTNSFLNLERNRIVIFFKFIVEYLKLQLTRFQNRNFVLEKPLVSIIIATYNRGKILSERTLPSIFNQSYSNFEIIIVGDHVIDNTEELISLIPDKRLKFINLEKRTIYPTDPISRWMVAGARPRNIAISKAKGEWIYVISDDDILLPNCLEKMV